MTTTASPCPTPPRLAYALTEPGRFVIEINRLLLAHPFLRRARGGDGHPVMVLPGFLGADGSTAALRYYIANWGYDTHGWAMGRNLGLRAEDPEFENRLAERLGTLVRKSGRKVSLVGGGLGTCTSRRGGGLLSGLRVGLGGEREVIGVLGQTLGSVPVSAVHEVPQDVGRGGAPGDDTHGAGPSRQAAPGDRRGGASALGGPVDHGDPRQPRPDEARGDVTIGHSGLLRRLLRVRVRRTLGAAGDRLRGRHTRRAAQQPGEYAALAAVPAPAPAGDDGLVARLTRIVDRREASAGHRHPHRAVLAQDCAQVMFARRFEGEPGAGQEGVDDCLLDGVGGLRFGSQPTDDAAVQAQHPCFALDGLLLGLDLLVGVDTHRRPPGQFPVRASGA